MIDFVCYGGDESGDCSVLGCGDEVEEQSIEEYFPKPGGTYTHQCGETETILIW